MEFKSIAEIYTVNAQIGERFKQFADGITESEANAVIEGEPWTLAALIEHVAMVENGISHMCSRMITGAKAEGKTSDGSFRLSDGFAAKLQENAGAKFEAPERVLPTGGVPIAESIARLDGSTAEIAAMQADLETTDVTLLTFPHPYFGPLNAAEWIMLAGSHVARHMAQAEQLLAKVRA